MYGIASVWLAVISISEFRVLLPEHYNRPSQPDLFSVRRYLRCGWVSIGDGAGKDLSVSRRSRYRGNTSVIHHTANHNDSL
jgi:hypothetical protein